MLAVNQWTLEQRSRLKSHSVPPLHAGWMLAYASIVPFHPESPPAPGLDAPNSMLPLCPGYLSHLAGCCQAQAESYAIFAYYFHNQYSI